MAICRRERKKEKTHCFYLTPTLWHLLWERCNNVRKIGTEGKASRGRACSKRVLSSNLGVHGTTKSVFW